MDISEWRRKEDALETHRVFTVDLNVRFRDLDAMGHVNNAVFFTYFEEGRKAFFQKHSKNPRSLDFPFILAHVACDYRKPVTLEDAIRLLLWVGEIGKRRFDFLYRIADGRNPETVYASGRSVQVSFDYRNQRSILLPREVIEHLLPFQEAAFQAETNNSI